MWRGVWPLGLLAIGCSSGASSCPDQPGGVCVGSASLAEDGSGTGGGSGSTVGSAADTTADEASGSGSSSWWDCGWSSRIQIEIETAGLTETHTNVPVAVLFDSTRIDYALANADGSDLRFILEDTELAYDVERWDAGGTSVAWVRLPSLQAGTVTMDLYFGNPGASPGEAVAAAWSGGYSAVWHFGDDLDDASATVGVAQPGASTTTEAFLGLGRDMPGGSVLGISIPTTAPLDGFLSGGGTISGWIFPRTFGGGGFGRIIDRSLGNGGQGGWSITFRADAIDEMELPGETIMFRRGYEDTTGSWHAPQSAIALMQWQHLAVVYDEGTPGTPPEIYIDGIAQPLGHIQAPMGALEDEAGNALSIGAPPFDASRTFDGILDEVRLADVPRSAEWIRLQVLLMQDEVLNFGEIESSDC